MPLAQPIPDLVSLELLRSVAELGSIRRAGEAHNISQPAASMRLRSLEQTLGLQLLDRTSGGARLTAEGQAVAEWSEQVINAMRSLVAGTIAIRKGGGRQLSIAASMTVAEYLIPKWLIRLRRVQPELNFSLQMRNSERVTDMVRKQEVDLGFIEGRSSTAGLQSRQVGSDALVLVVSNHHPWTRRRRPISPEELARTPLVLREAGSGTREVLELALGEFGFGVTALVELGSTTAIKAEVISGTAPAVLSKLATQDDIRDGRMTSVPIDGLCLERSIRAIWTRHRPLAEPARRLLAAISEEGSE